MKISNIINILFTGLCIMVFASCIKSRNGATDFTGLNPIIQIPEGGLANFSNQAINFSPLDEKDTDYFHVNYAAKNVAPKDITVTLSVDPDALDTYNNDPANTLKFDPLPTNAYAFNSETKLIKAGTSYTDTIQFIVFPNKIDFTKNYMVAISIKDAQGNNISGNFGTIYYHVIGNKLAGVYSVVGTCYNYSGSIGYSGGPIPTSYLSTKIIPSPKAGKAVDANTLTFDFANLGSANYHYVITYDETDPLNLTVKNDFTTYISGFKVTTHTYDPVLHKLHIVSTYNNAADGTGNDRIIDEVLTKL